MSPRVHARMHACAHMPACMCEAQVKVAPASSCVSGRIDHLIQIKDSPSARGRDELVTQCKIEPEPASAGPWCQSGIALPFHCFCLSSGKDICHPAAVCVSAKIHYFFALIQRNHADTC